jgi:hypothetical protein
MMAGIENQLLIREESIMSKKIVVLLAIVYFSAYSSLVLASGTEYKPSELIVRFAPKE